MGSKARRIGEAALPPGVGDRPVSDRGGSARGWIFGEDARQRWGEEDHRRCQSVLRVLDGPLANDSACSVSEWASRLAQAVRPSRSIPGLNLPRLLWHDYRRKGFHTYMFSPMADLRWDSVLEQRFARSCEIFGKSWSRFLLLSQLATSDQK